MPDPRNAFFVSDQSSLKKPRAISIEDRRNALTWCLNNEWAGQDIGQIERIDDNTEMRYGWEMWLRS